MDEINEHAVGFLVWSNVPLEYWPEEHFVSSLDEVPDEDPIEVEIEEEME